MTKHKWHLDKERIVQPHNHEVAFEKGYAHNGIRTTKYTLVTFLPKNLFEQFHRLANVYFLFIVILNWVPSVQAFGREVAMLPLLFVLAVTAIKDAFEDRRRANQDKKTNNTIAKVYNKQHKCYEDVAWRHVQVGDVIRLKCDDVIPADLLLLHSSHEDGVCYLETANLDGETNLKQRRVYCDRGSNEDEFDVANFNEELKCEHPNSKIYQFNGHITHGGTVVPLDTNNMLLRGCVLRNTGTVIGLVVYAGHDTKAMLNNTGPRSKRSKLERAMNYQILYCCIILLILCVLGGLCAGLWTQARDYTNILYLPWQEGDPRPPLEGFTRVWTFFIILQVMVPISLYVSIEMVKLFQIYFIQEDVELYHEETDTKMLCRALNITEDLGQINYVFSDKTGTLTQNKMVFHTCSVGGVIYRHQAQEEGKDYQDAFSFPSDPNLVSNLAADRGEIGKRASPLHIFMLCLSASNTVVPNRKDGKVKFEAESPDEAALVSAASVYDYHLEERKLNTVTVSIRGQRHTYEVLAVLDFDSTRKRMSVVLRLPDGTLRLLCKGADSAITSVLGAASSDHVLAETSAHLDEFARSGLRTLCYAYRDIAHDEYEDWAHRFLEANVLLGEERKQRRVELFQELEQNMILVGATGIEDKLQDGVPEAIADLRHAGLKVWVLTGDKQETAIEIAMTCRLITRRMHTIILNSEYARLHYDKGKTIATVAHHRAARREVLDIINQHLQDIEQAQQGDRRELALVIDGPTLFYAVQEADDVKHQFLRLAEQTKVVVACRTTPLQKAQVVGLVKDNRDAMTLAIGDGANDVSMIQMAHVGVGISGQEGMQAVMASDFAIAQFRFLVKLMLVHGHWSYDRIANMILYFFYKNSCLVWVIFYFQIFAGFSGQPAIEQLYLQTYNLLWTSIPPIITAVFDQDVQPNILLNNPALYEQGRLDLTYSGKFFPTMLDGFYQSIVIFFVPYFVFRDTVVNEGLLVFGTVIFYCTVVANLLHLCIITRNYIWIHYLGLLWSIGGLFAFSLLYNGVYFSDSSLVPDPYFVMQETIADSRFWFCLFFVPIVAVGPRFITMFSHRWFTPTIASFAREKSELETRAAGLDSTACMHYPCMPCQMLAEPCCVYTEPHYSSDTLDVTTCVSYAPSNRETVALADMHSPRQSYSDA
ncbi:ATP10A protein [Salpingoeca rosetta]|uniref:Phospholipid-transporting ATPase n=1 Tax=Salpingoeca rosetta (strain ATCC 50818 / BSB-021) TaxID=946362 RepID=F2U0L7_SALR5|nr:ATP10A protein [Salpingoeca rosetta]EGD80945.1 ATP10A protein [Salpingoeca rosetta]|eukprot:XP_004997506.1 ATP10A protein [Salpingoeca rosetta]